MEVYSNTDELGHRRAKVHGRGGREITREPWRSLCFVFFPLVTVVLAPVWIPLHFVLRALGRRGFVDVTSLGGGRWSLVVEVTRASFARRETADG